jgi:glutathione S-transferase
LEYTDAAGALRLFGQFSIADCFYAPVVLRFKTYGIDLGPAANDYYESMLAHPSLQKWVAHALEETEIVPEDEAGVDI